ncbi:hypothetical protein CKF54_00425 [Psittacicella hinzii]|uniref:Uncharacterized protein n=1 Tax=Psittacicella hinzii TaxID=2028575 RepID=A0A3A1Y9Y9_9GAMM|nr:hypothetical protein [Psittacicella hinzii]RIY34495.1 hypothetical protein CKF54_00425 [Psittacicella hinzii]
MAGKKKNVEIKKELDRINLKTIANILNVDFRTIKKHYTEVLKLDIDNNSVDPKDLFQWLFDYAQGFDKRKNQNKAKHDTGGIPQLSDDLTEAEAKEAFELFGTLHLTDPARYKTVQESVYLYIKNQLAMQKLINIDDARRIFFDILTGIQETVSGFLNYLKEEMGATPEELDRMEILIRELQVLIHKDTVEVVDKIPLVEGEKITIKQAVNGKGVEYYVIAPSIVKVGFKDEEKPN